MRIVGGTFRSRKISFPSDISITRPTKDRIREAIFSALGDISNTNCLDLYAGSGAMGLEAISRNAGRCYFVDNSKNAINVINENISSLGIKDKTKVIFKDDLNAIRDFILENIQFDIVFLDPPYIKNNYDEIINYLLENNLLTESAIIVCEANRDICLTSLDKFKKVKNYKYGEIKITILWR